MCQTSRRLWGKMPLMVVGGIGTSNVQEYFAAGGIICGESVSGYFPERGYTE